jgi:hypothetical protein
MSTGEMVPFFLGVLANVRLIHWQTKSYARHVATDGLLKELTDLVDTFVEAHMGRYGALSVSGKSSVDLVDKADPSKYVAAVRDRIMAFKLQDADLMSVRDDMIIVLNKTLFLFTLK